MKVGEIKLETILRTVNIKIQLRTISHTVDIKKRETFVAPLWVRRRSSQFEKPKNGMLFLFFKNTEKQKTYPLSSLFKRYGFSVVRSGENPDGYWADFETEAKTLRGCLSIVNRLRRDGILRDVKADAIYKMHAIAKFSSSQR